MLPQDPAILLSAVNTKLRDFYANLDELCAAEGADHSAELATAKKYRAAYLKRKGAL